MRVCVRVCIAVVSLLSKAERSQLNEDDDSVYQELVESHDDIQPERTASYNNINPNSNQEVGKVRPSWCGWVGVGREASVFTQFCTTHSCLSMRVVCDHSSCQTHCLARSLKVLMLALCPGLLSSDGSEALLLQWHETSIGPTAFLSTLGMQFTCQRPVRGTLVCTMLFPNCVYLCQVNTLRYLLLTLWSSEFPLFNLT